MAGTRAGGLKTIESVKAKFGPDHYKKIGAKGGAAKGPDYQKGGAKASGFAKNSALARKAGAKGGKVSRRSGPSKAKLASQANVAVL